ncbi:MAG: acyltransferase [Phocaeicola sp.]|uniref:acyltransferase n=1 Tax=Phocaeicola TaxID=909656 RepID=UPI00234F4D91|nr:acyltransferase [Phocaeicola oris]MCE2617554.1 acyltransferase [Phocaeicola oris]
MTSTINQPSRVVWLDVVRFFAMFLLICCHSADPFNFYGGNDTSNINQINFWGQIYGSFFRPCVPLFAMLTGALLLPVKDEASFFYKKRITRVLWPFLIWSFIYCITPYIFGLFGLDGNTLIQYYPSADVFKLTLGDAAIRISNIPFNFSSFDIHMWYIYLLIGLYLYIPIFSAWVEKASQKAKLYFLLAWGVTLFLPYYYNYVNEYLWGTCSWNAYGMLYYFAGFNGYLLLGHYIRHYINWSLQKTLIIGIPMFIVGYLITYFGFSYMANLDGHTEDQLELFFTFNSINVVLETIPIFLIAKKITIKSKKIINLLANLTLCGFGIYMIHELIVGPIITLMRALNIPIYIQIPCGALCTFAVCWIIIAFIHKVMSKKAARVFVG